MFAQTVPECAGLKTAVGRIHLCLQPDLTEGVLVLAEDKDVTGLQQPCTVGGNFLEAKTGSTIRTYFVDREHVKKHVSACCCRASAPPDNQQPPRPTTPNCCEVDRWLPPDVNLQQTCWPSGHSTVQSTGTRHRHMTTTGLAAVVLSALLIASAEAGPHRLAPRCDESTDTHSRAVAMV